MIDNKDLDDLASRVHSNRAKCRQYLNKNDLAVEDSLLGLAKCQNDLTKFMCLMTLSEVSMFSPDHFDLDKALSYLEQAEKVYPDHHLLLTTKGMYLRAKGQFGEAIRCMTRSVEQNSTDIAYQVRLVETLLMTSSTKEAERFLISHPQIYSNAYGVDLMYPLVQIYIEAGQAT